MSEPTRQDAEPMLERATMCHACGETLFHGDWCDLPDCEHRPSATPKPAPDALREALDAEIERWENDKRVLYPDAEVLESLSRIKAALPSPDGAGEAVRYSAQVLALAKEIASNLYCARNDFDNMTSYRVDLIYDKAQKLVTDLATPPVRADREALDRLYNEKIESIIDQWAADTLERKFASSWHYGELWKQIREAILSHQPPQSSSEGAAVASHEGDSPHG